MDTASVARRERRLQCISKHPMSKQLNCRHDSSVYTAAHRQNFFDSWMSAAAAAAHSFNKLLSQPKAASKSRATGETDDGTKKLRRMILVEGIPSAVVRYIIADDSRYAQNLTANKGSNSASSNMENTTSS